MKKAQREIYLVLTKEVDWQLCSFCKFAESRGYECGEIACDHPQRWKLPGDLQDLEPGQDCWGFRPSHSVSFIADIVGILLEKGWRSATWWEDEGVLKIAGTAL